MNAREVLEVAAADARALLDSTDDRSDADPAALVRWARLMRVADIDVLVAAVAVARESGVSWATVTSWLGERDEQFVAATYAPAIADLMARTAR